PQTSTISLHDALPISAALHSGGHSESGGEDDGGSDAPEVKVVGESGTPKKQGAKGSIDFRGVPAGAVQDAFGKWEKEVAKYGFADRKSTSLNSSHVSI